MIKAIMPGVMYSMADVHNKSLAYTIILVAVAIFSICLFYSEVVHIRKAKESNEERSSRTTNVAAIIVGILFSATCIMAATASASVYHWLSVYTPMQVAYIEKVVPAIERIEKATEEDEILDDIHVVAAYMNGWSTESKKADRFVPSKVPVFKNVQGWLVNGCGNVDGYNIILNASYDDIKVDLSEKAKENIEATGKYIVEDTEAMDVAD